MKKTKKEIHRNRPLAAGRFTWSRIEKYMDKLNSSEELKNVHVVNPVINWNSVPVADELVILYTNNNNDRAVVLRNSCNDLKREAWGLLDKEDKIYFGLVDNKINLTEQHLLFKQGPGVSQKESARKIIKFLFD